MGESVSGARFAAALAVDSLLAAQPSRADDQPGMPPNFALGTRHQEEEIS
jgi:hypothetical protein